LVAEVLIDQEALLLKCTSEETKEFVLPALHKTSSLQKQNGKLLLNVSGAEQSKGVKPCRKYTGTKIEKSNTGSQRLGAEVYFPWIARHSRQGNFTPDSEPKTWESCSRNSYFPPDLNTGVQSFCRTGL